MFLWVNCAHLRNIKVFQLIQPHRMAVSSYSQNVTARELCRAPSTIHTRLKICVSHLSTQRALFACREGRRKALVTFLRPFTNVPPTIQCPLCFLHPPQHQYLAVSKHMYLGSFICLSPCGICVFIANVTSLNSSPLLIPAFSQRFDQVLEKYQGLF